MPPWCYGTRHKHYSCVFLVHTRYHLKWGWMQTRLDLRLSEPGRYMNSVLEKKRGGKNCTFTDTYCRLMKKCCPVLSQPTDCSKHISAKAILLPLTIYKPYAREQICVETFSITNVIFSCRWKKIVKFSYDKWKVVYAKFARVARSWEKICRRLVEN